MRGNAELSEYPGALGGRGALIDGEERCHSDSEEGRVSFFCSQNVASP